MKGYIVFRAMILAAALMSAAFPALAEHGEGHEGDVRLVRAICLDQEALAIVSYASIENIDLAGELWNEMLRTKRCGMFQRPIMVKLIRKLNDFIDAGNDKVSTWEVMAPNGRTVYANFLEGHVEPS